MKKWLLFSFIASFLFFFGCTKNNILPAYTPAVPVIFSVSSLNHTVDSVNVGDTIYLNAAGTVYDTTKNIYVYMSASSTISGASSVYNFGSPTSLIKVNRVIGATNAAGLYTWTATLMLPGATLVPHKTKLTITGNFIYQLSLSSELGNLSATDAGIKNKTVYVY